MKKRKIFIALILVIILSIVGVLVVTGAIGFGGYRVTVHGTAYYDALGGWGVSYKNRDIAEDNMFTILPGWYWPWETKDVNIVVHLTNLGSGTEYTVDTWSGTLSAIIGSKDFDVTFHHLPQGNYDGMIYLYEVEKGFLFGENSRVQKATCHFTLTI